MRLVIRGWLNGEKKFEEHLDIEEDQIEGIIGAAAADHAELLKSGPHMVEFEFLDEPDPNQRFVRIGTDPRRMVLPIAIDPKEPS